jgi:hypothetical protein
MAAWRHRLFLEFEHGLVQLRLDFVDGDLKAHE